MHQKVIICGVKEAARSIRQTKVKRIGNLIKPVQRWENDKDQFMRDISTVIYTQNDHIKQKLLATGNHPLVEATRDSYWGAGALLSSKEIEKGTWQGKNTLGIMPKKDLRRNLRS